MSMVHRSSLRQQIADALRDEMLTGRLCAGERFTVKQIADLYEVSATPVREALVDLAAQGLLELEHHRGFRVREFTWQDYQAVVEARGLVLEGVFRRIRERGMRPIAAADLGSVRRRGNAAQRAVLAGELDVLIGCDLRYWRELSALIGNVYLSEFFDRLRVQSWMFTVPYLRHQPDLASLCWHGHTRLVDAVEATDLKATQDTVAEYNRESLEVMRRLTGNDHG